MLGEACGLRSTAKTLNGTRPCLGQTMIDGGLTPGTPTIQLNEGPMVLPHAHLVVGEPGIGAIDQPQPN